MGKIVICIVIVSVLLFWFLCWYALCSYRQKKLRHIARTVIEKFNKHNINYWVDYGTLLGIVRENDIIFHDTDVDIGVPYDESFHTKIREIMDEIGGEMHIKYYPWKHYRVSYNNPIFGYYVDIYNMNDQGDKYTDIEGEIPKELVGNTTVIEWNGLPVRVPEHTKETLVYRYGEDYMTPKRFFGNKPVNILK